MNLCCMYHFALQQHSSSRSPVLLCDPSLVVSPSRSLLVHLRTHRSSPSPPPPYPPPLAPQATATPCGVTSGKSSASTPPRGSAPTGRAFHPCTRGGHCASPPAAAPAGSASSCIAEATSSEVGEAAAGGAAASAGAGAGAASICASRASRRGAAVSASRGWVCECERGSRSEGEDEDVGEVGEGKRE